MDAGPGYNGTLNGKIWSVANLKENQRFHIFLVLCTPSEQFLNVYSNSKILFGEGTSQL
jgi:hypothetical protein